MKWRKGGRSSSARETRFDSCFSAWLLLFASLAFITYYTSVALTYYYNPARNNAAGRSCHPHTTSWCPFLQVPQSISGRCSYAVHRDETWKAIGNLNSFSSTKAPRHSCHHRRKQNCRGFKSKWLRSEKHVARTQPHDAIDLPRLSSPSNRQSAIHTQCKYHPNQAHAVPASFHCSQPNWGSTRTPTHRPSLRHFRGLCWCPQPSASGAG